MNGNQHLAKQLQKPTIFSAGVGVGDGFSAGKRCLSEASCFSKEKPSPTPASPPAKDGESVQEAKLQT